MHPSARNVPPIPRVPTSSATTSKIRPIRPIKPSLFTDVSRSVSSTLFLAFHRIGIWNARKSNCQMAASQVVCPSGEIVCPRNDDGALSCSNLGGSCAFSGSSSPTPQITSAIMTSGGTTSSSPPSSILPSSSTSSANSGQQPSAVAASPSAQSSSASAAAAQQTTAPPAIPSIRWVRQKHRRSQGFASLRAH